MKHTPSMRDSGVRYYENDDLIVFSALKVASRYLDNLFYDDDLDKVKILLYNEVPGDDNLYFKTSAERQPNDPSLARIDKTVNNIIHGKCRKKVIFLCRHPYKRHVSSLNHIFHGHLTLAVSYLISKRFPEMKSDFSWHAQAFETYERRLKEDKHMRISEQNFKVLKDYDTWPNNKLFREKFFRGKERIPTNVINAIKKIALDFIKSESKGGWDNNHYAPYLKIYDSIINPKNIKNVRIVDIDKENISKIFHTNMEKIGPSPKSTKPIIEKLVKSSKIDLIDSETVIYNKLMKL